MRRRAFLGVAGGAATVALIAGGLRALPTIPSRPAAEAADALSWIAYRDGRFILSIPRAEIGQNISTGLKQIACAELGVAWDAVEVIAADTASIAPYRATVGSESIQDFALPLAQACAALRDAVAAGLTGVVDVPERPREALRAFQPGALPSGVPLVGVEAVVTGRPLFAADIRLPNMAYGRVLRAPRSPELGSRPARWNEAAARAEPGFLAIVEDGGLAMNDSVGLGVVAATPGALDRIEAALAVVWESDAPPDDDSIETTLDIDRRIASGEAEYDVAEDAMDGSAPWDVDLRIDTPLAAHAAIEPRAAVADIDAQGGRVWVGSQDPFFTRDALADRLGLGAEDVVVVPQRVGGGFGGKVIPLVEIEAAALSRAVGRPVKVQWTRRQEFAFACHRPATSHRVRARIEAGRVRDWSHRMASGHVIYSNAVLPPWMQSLTDMIGDGGAARNLAPPYDFEAKAIGYDLHRLPIRTAAWRGLGAGPNGLAIEMAMEACALRAGRDPIAFRLAHIADPRLKAALLAVERLAGPAQSAGRGVGCGVYKGVSYGAVIADVGRRDDGALFLQRLFCAHDCGVIVNADQVRAQCEGNIVWSIGMVLSDRLTLADGGIAEADFAEAPIPTISEVPPIEIALIDSDSAPTGAGETLMVAAPAAIANAFAAAMAEQPRRLPLTAADVGA